MGAKQMGLAWIPVSDFKKTIKFYTEVVGLKVAEMSEEWGWAELEGPNGGTRLGIAQYQAEGCPVAPGQNAILSYLVENIEQTRERLQKQGVKLIGEIEEVPGHVKMQLAQDTEGNYIHFVQEVEALPTPKHHHHQHGGGCCGGH